MTDRDRQYVRTRINTALRNLVAAADFLDGWARREAEASGRLTEVSGRRLVQEAISALNNARTDFPKPQRKRVF